MQPPPPPPGWPSAPDHPGPALLRPLHEDWLTIWHSELAALALDREWQEAQLRVVDSWAAHALAVLHATRHATADDGRAAPGRAGPVPQKGTPPTDAAPGARDAELDRLAARVAELERRLATPGPPSR